MGFLALRSVPKGTLSVVNFCKAVGITGVDEEVEGDMTLRLVA